MQESLEVQRYIPQGFRYVSPPKFEGLIGGGEAHLSKPSTIKYVPLIEILLTIHPVPIRGLHQPRIPYRQQSVHP